MKLLMTADAVGGVWTYAQALTSALAAHDVEVLVAVMGPRPSDAQLDEWRRRSAAKVVHGAFDLEWMPAPWPDVDRSGTWLLELEQAFQPDVVHLNGYAHATLRWRAPCLVVAHSCVLSWWRAVHQAPAPAEWNLYRERIAAGLRAADHLVAPTRAMLSQLRTEHAVLPPRSVIHNGLSHAEFSGPATPPDSFVLGTGRVWDEAKNLATLDRAAQRLPWPVYIAGDAAASGPPRTLAHAHALGRLDAPELRQWLRRAGIYASPAVYEPFGLGVLEAALSRCALVLGDIESLRELWEGAAVFVDPRDVGAWHAALRELMADRVRAADLAAAARTRALEYSAERMSTAYRALYVRLARVARPVASSRPIVHGPNLGARP